MGTLRHKENRSIAEALECGANTHADLYPNWPNTHIHVDRNSDEYTYPDADWPNEHTHTDKYANSHFDQWANQSQSTVPRGRYHSW